MNNFKKIGLTALAASLVSVSANAGELTMSGAASMNVGGYSGTNHDGGATFSMGNQFTVSGGGELDNGMTVSISYQLDNNAADRCACLSCFASSGRYCLKAASMISVRDRYRCR